MQNEDKPGAASPSTPSSSAAARDEITREFAESGAAGGPVYGDERPLIKWSDGELPRMVDEAEAALMADKELHLYQRGPLVVRVVRRSATSVRNIKRPAGALGIVPVDLNFLTETLTRAAHWEKYDGRKNEMKRVNAPSVVGATYLARSGHWKLPLLLATISAPTLRPDGSVLQFPGYDRELATWFDPGGVDFPHIPDRPTREDADKALALLRDVFSEFPFLGDPDTNTEVLGKKCTLDESVFLSMLLTGGVRRSLDAAPMLGITAPDMQSGKTLLAETISLVWQGVSPTVMRYPDTDEEAAKAALAFLLEGDAIVLIDNVERTLKGDWLCVILTSEEYTGRLLGRSEVMKVPTSTLMIATGNHLVLEGDLRTRALLCRIDAQVVNPGVRTFKRDLKDWIPSHRPELVAAALTIMRAFVVSGIPTTDLVGAWSRFQRWSDMCRAPLVWLGLPDPCESLKLLEQDDPKRVQLVQLLTGWWKKFGAKEQTAADVLGDLQRTAPDFVSAAWREALQNVAMERGEWKPKKLAHYLKHSAGRRIALEDKDAGKTTRSTMWFESHGHTSDKVTLWKVVRIVG